MNQRLLFPLGVKIMLVTFFLLCISFALSGAAMMALAREALRKDLADSIARDSRLFAAASRNLMKTNDLRDRTELKQQ